jgi:hypothetical protein
VIPVQSLAMVAQAAPEADASVAEPLVVLVAVVVGLVFLRLLVSVGRLVVAAAFGLVRLVISRVLLLLVALALLAGLLTDNVGLADGLWPQGGPPHEPPIARKLQDRHIKGTPEYRQRLKLGTPTSRWDDPAQADPLTREAWRKGKAVPGRPTVRDWDAGRRIGADPDGGSLTHVRVSRDRHGRIYGWPAG